MKKSIIIAIALAFSSAAITHAQTTAPSKPATAEPKDPAGVDPTLTSADPEYGYSQKKPIKVGSKDQFGGVLAERAYFNTLRDEAGKPVTFERQGSFGAGPDGNILDGYEVRTSTGRKALLYIDMYHPDNDPKTQLAPKDFFKAKWPQRLTKRCSQFTLTKCARAKIIAALIWFLMCCHLVACGKANQAQAVMQSLTRSFAAAHMMLWFAFTMQRGNVIETHEHAGDFKEWWVFSLAPRRISR